MTARTATKRGKAARACRVDIHIASQGNVNIYNCTSGPGEGTPPSPTEGCETFPLPDGQCVPVVQGAKPKQSQARKLAKLAANTPVPSALAASFFQLSRRFLQGSAPANPLEERVFAIMAALPPAEQSLLSCCVDSFDAIPTETRDCLFDTSLTGDPNTPIDPITLAAAVSQELAGRVGLEVFENATAVEEERPGLNRFFDIPIGTEFFDVQVRICRVNGLRTISFTPTLGPGDYEPAELQQHCQPVVVNGETQVNCEVQHANCPGNFLSDGTCLRVPEIAAASGITLEGVNYISTDAKVRLTAQAPGTATAEVETHVFGDVDTPRTETIGGKEQLIRDCRVHDRLTFQVPADLPPGIYTIQVIVPNVSGFPNLGDQLVSNVEYIQVIPPATARFQIVAEKLYARAETSPSWLGSDEVGLHVIAVPMFTDGTLGSAQLLNGSKGREFDDVDSGESRTMNDVIFAHGQPIVGVAMAVMGYEIDSRKAYNEQITNFTDAFIHILEVEWDFIKDYLKEGVGALAKLGVVYAAIVVGIALVIVLAVNLIYAAWAPADPIIEDQLGLSAVDLAALTSANFPSPGLSTHRTPQDIEVNVTPLEKGPQQYREFREYHSDDEDSRYELYYRYNRVA